MLSCPRGVDWGKEAGSLNRVGLYLNACGWCVLQQEARGHVARQREVQTAKLWHSLVPIAMSSTLRINYIILDEPDVDHVLSVEIDSSDTVTSLRTKIASNHYLLVPGQIVKFEKVSMSMDDEEINDKLRKFTFTSTANTWKATTKLSAVIVPADLAPDHLHLIIRA